MSYLDKILMCFGCFLMGGAMVAIYHEPPTYRFWTRGCIVNVIGSIIALIGILLAVLGPEPAHGATHQYPPLCDRCDRAATRMCPIVREGACLINEQTGEPERMFYEVCRSPRCAYHAGFEPDRLPPIDADVWVSAARCFAAGWIYTPCK